MKNIFEPRLLLESLNKIKTQSVNIEHELEKAEDSRCLNRYLRLQKVSINKKRTKSAIFYIFRLVKVMNRALT